MSTGTFNQLLVNPARAELLESLGSAAKAANGKRVSEALQLRWPPNDLEAWERQLEEKKEGFHQWNGPPKDMERGIRSFVLVIWWTDFGGRKHYRIFAHRTKAYGPRKVNWLYETAPPPPLEQIYPQGLFFIHDKDHLEPRVFCNCGAWGSLQDMGWMGKTCGPCHDWQEEHQKPRFESPVNGIQASELTGAFSISPDSSLLVIGCPSQLEVWELTVKEKINEFDIGEKFYPTDALFSSSNDFLLYRNCFNAFICHAKNGQMIQEVPCSDDERLIWDAGFVPGREEFIICRGRIHRFGVHGSTPIAEYSATFPHSHWRWRAMTISGDGKWVAGANSEQDVVVWDLSTAREVTRFRVGEGEVGSLAFSPDGRTLATGGEGSRGSALANLWDWRTGQNKVVLQSADHFNFAGSEFSPDGRFLLETSRLETTLAYRHWHCWLTATGKRLKSMTWPERNLQRCEFSPDGKHFVTLDHQGILRFWPMSFLDELVE